ncbi:MAG: hypothetical protein ACJAX4_001898 [Clostridium sp.]|jgi:hypothetical protein
MHRERGTVHINLIKHFQTNNLGFFTNPFEEAMQLYKKEYARLQVQVLAYDSMNTFRKDYLGLVSV